MRTLHQTGLKAALFSNDEIVSAVAGDLLRGDSKTGLRLDSELLDRHPELIGLLRTLTIRLQEQVAKLREILLRMPTADFDSAGLDADTLSALFSECRLAAEAISSASEPISKFVREVSSGKSNCMDQCGSGSMLPESVYLYPEWLEDIERLAFCAVGLLQDRGGSVGEGSQPRSLSIDPAALRMLRCFDSEDPASHRCWPISPCREGGYLDIELSCGSFEFPQEWSVGPDVFVCYTPADAPVIDIEPIDDFAQHLKQLYDDKDGYQQRFEEVCEGLNTRVIENCPDGRLHLPEQMLVSVGLSLEPGASCRIVPSYYRYEVYNPEVLDEFFADIDLSIFEL